MKKILKSASIALALSLGLACGGGGGGGGAPSTVVILSGNATPTGNVTSTGNTTSSGNTSVVILGSNGFYSVRLKSGASVSSYSLTSAYSDTITDSARLTFLKSSGNIIIATQESTSEVSEMLLALEGGQPADNKLSGDWLAGIYGTVDSTIVNGLLAEIKFDTSGNATFSKHTTSTGITTFDGSLPTGAFSITSGKITWGTWTGMTTKDGTKMLLSNAKLVLLAAKTGSYSAIPAKSYNGAYMYHGNGTDIKAGKNAITFTATSVSGVVGTQSYTWPTVSYSSGNSYIGLNNGTGVEPGFRADSEFFVIANPSPNHPFFLVAPLP